MINPQTLQIITGVFIGVAAGYLGSFMILRRMALVGDALSHIALPGIAMALLFNINPFLGAFATLFVGIIVIWLIENKTNLSTEALVGLMFTSALAIGLLITPQEDILDALIGDITKVTLLDTVFAVAFSILIFVVMRAISKQFILSTLSHDLARSTGVKVARNNFIYLLLVAIIVALSIKAVGTLLTGALVIIPAITSKNISSSTSQYTIVSSLLGLVSAVGGIYFASFYGLAPGPLVVLTSAGIFLISLVFKK